MTGDVKAAAERLRMCDAGGFIAEIYSDFKFPFEQYAEDRHATSKAYLAEQDPKPVTEDWLRSVGFQDSAAGESLLLRCKDSPLGHLRHTAMAFNLITGNWTANGLGCKECKTRGDVRRLAAALGITLREGAQSE